VALGILSARFSTLHTHGILFTRRALLNVQYSKFPLPEIQCVAQVEKLLLSTQPKILQPLATRAALEAIKCLGVNPDDETGIVSPAEYAQKYFMQVADFQVVGNSDNPCPSGTDLV
jgi:hypothetical protein